MDERRVRSGFTLIEMLITLVILGILATILWLRVEGVNADAYRASAKADLRSVAMAQELYHQVNMVYGALEDLSAYQATDGVTVTLTHADNRGFAATATHAGLGGVVCGYFAGQVPDGAASPAEESGVAVCE